MNKYIFWSISVALAGFLFGFDTAVISGADLPIQKLWETTPLFHGTFIMSAALWGTVIGALFGGIPCDAFGRKKTLIWVGVLYFISAVGSALAPEPYSFSFFRFIGGIGIGASSVAAPAYISELVDAKNRGRLVALYQLNIVTGILLAFLSNYLLKGIGENSWRWMLGVVAVPSFIYLILVFYIPESPRWLLIMRKDEKKARSVFEKMNTPNIDQTIQSILESETKTIKSSLFSYKYKFLIFLAFTLAFFNQMSGINFVIYYAPRIFESAGLGSANALLSTAGIGLINLVFTLAGMYLIDRSGRKSLMLIGSIGYIVSLAAVSWAFYTHAGGTLVVLFLFLFIASHAIGQGAVIWVFISEIFPNHIRANGQALGAGTHWVMAALITLFTLFFIDMFNNNPWPLFALFAFMMILQLLFVIFIMPETKGISLEELEKKLRK